MAPAPCASLLLLLLLCHCLAFSPRSLYGRSRVSLCTTRQFLFYASEKHQEAEDVVVNVNVEAEEEVEEEETSHLPTPPNTPPFVEAQLLQDLDQADYSVYLYEQEVQMLREKMGYMQDELLDEQNEFRIQTKTWTETLETFSQELSTRDAELNALHALLKEQRASSYNDTVIAKDDFKQEENQEPENDIDSTTAAAATIKGVDSEQNMQVPPPKADNTSSSNSTTTTTTTEHKEETLSILLLQEQMDTLKDQLQTTRKQSIKQKLVALDLQTQLFQTQKAYNQSQELFANQTASLQLALDTKERHLQELQQALDQRVAEFNATTQTTALEDDDDDDDDDDVDNQSNETQLQKVETQLAESQQETQRVRQKMQDEFATFQLKSQNKLDQLKRELQDQQQLLNETMAALRTKELQFQKSQKDWERRLENEKLLFVVLEKELHLAVGGKQGNETMKSLQAPLELQDNPANSTTDTTLEAETQDENLQDPTVTTDQPNNILDETTMLVEEVLGILEGAISMPANNNKETPVSFALAKNKTYLERMETIRQASHQYQQLHNELQDSKRSTEELQVLLQAVSLQQELLLEQNNHNNAEESKDQERFVKQNATISELHNQTQAMQQMIAEHEKTIQEQEALLCQYQTQEQFPHTIDKEDKPTAPLTKSRSRSKIGDLPHAPPFRRPTASKATNCVKLSQNQVTATTTTITTVHTDDTKNSNMGVSRKVRAVKRILPPKVLSSQQVPSKSSVPRTVKGQQKIAKGESSSFPKRVPKVVRSKRVRVNEQEVSSNNKPKTVVKGASRRPLTTKDKIRAPNPEKSPKVKRVKRVVPRRGLGWNSQLL